MHDINFPHPCDPARKPLFLDDYYRMYGLMKLRAQVRQEYCQAIDVAEEWPPRLPDELQAALEELEQETERVRARRLPPEAHERAMAELDWRRDEIHARADALGVGAWQAAMGDVETARACKARLRYCEHCLARVRERIAALQASTKLMDPFAMLADKHGLDDDELELLAFLYFRQFERPEPIAGALLLGEVMGRQAGVIRGQAMLFDEGRLVAGGLVEVAEKGRGALDSTFAVSRWANLVISGLHPEYPHLQVEWTVTEGRTA